MQTILETFYALVRAKLLLLQCKRFLQWKDAAAPAQTSASHLIQQAAQCLARKQEQTRHAELRKVLQQWQHCVQVDHIRLLAQEKLKNAELKFTAQLRELKNQRTYLAKKISDLEARKAKSAANRLKRKPENPDSLSQGKLAALLAENQSLKHNLTSKEQQILSFFEEMGAMISKAKASKLNQ